MLLPTVPNREVASGLPYTQHQHEVCKWWERPSQSEAEVRLPCSFFLFFFFNGQPHLIFAELLHVWKPTSFFQTFSLSLSEREIALATDAIVFVLPFSAANLLFSKKEQHIQLCNACRQKYHKNIDHMKIFANKNKSYSIFGSHFWKTWAFMLQRYEQWELQWKHVSWSVFCFKYIHGNG